MRPFRVFAQICPVLPLKPTGPFRAMFSGFQSDNNPIILHGLGALLGVAKACRTGGGPGRGWARCSRATASPCARTYAGFLRNPSRITWIPQGSHLRGRGTGARALEPARPRPAAGERLLPHTAPGHMHLRGRCARRTTRRGRAHVRRGQRGTPVRALEVCAHILCASHARIKRKASQQTFLHFYSL